MTDEVIIRVSSLPSWPDCERRGAARLFYTFIEQAGYTLNRSPYGIAAAIGTSVHKSASVILTEKAKSGTLPPASVAEDCAADEVKEHIARGMDFDESNGMTRNSNEAVAQVTRMARLYRNRIGPKVEPIMIETRLEAEVRPGLILSGQPDTVAQEPNQVRDLKTGVRLGAYAAQIGGYSLLARTPRPEYPEGLPIETAAIDFIKRVRPNKDQPEPVEQRVPVALAEQLAEQIIGRIDETLTLFRQGNPERGIRPGDPRAFMTNPGSQLCSRKYCSAYGSNFCDAWRAKESVDD